MILPTLLVGTLLAALVGLAAPAHGQGGITCNGCDTIRQEGVSLYTGPTNVSPRIVLQYANTIRQAALVTPPGDLQTRLGQVAKRIILQYGNTLRQAALVTPPGELQTRLGQVAKRIILQYANTSRQMALAYPKALINDTTPPKISNVQARYVGGAIKVTWTTDEFATSQVRFGTAPGAYTRTAADALFATQHELTLTGIAAGETIYFVVQGVDRSGNLGASEEYRVKARSGTYLPMVRR